MSSAPGLTLAGHARRAGRGRRAVAARAGRTFVGVGRGMRRTIAVVAFLALWEIAPRVGITDRTFLTPFSEVLDAWWDLARDGTLWTHVHTSLVRAAAGYGIAVAVAVPLGFAIGWYAVAADVLNPLLELFRGTAPLALLPVFTLILGIGETSKVAIVVYACVFPLVLNTISGVRTVDALLIKSARSIGLSSFALFRKVILPAALPTVFTGARLAGAAAILVLVAAEMVGAKAGLGYLINYSQFNFQVPQMYAGILTIAVLGVSVNAALVHLERRFSSWRPDATSRS